MITATRSYVEAIITALNAEGKVTFKEGDSWKTDIKNKVVYFVMTDLLEMDYIQAKGCVLHELAHCLYTEPNEPTELLKKFPGAMMAVYNCFEDIRVDVKMRGAYGNFYIEATEETILHAGIKIANAIHMGKPPTDSLVKIILNMSLWYMGDKAVGHVNERIIDSIRKIVYQFTFPVCSEPERSAIKHIFDGGHITKIMKMGSLKQTQDYVDECIYPILKDFIHPDDPTGEIAKHNERHEDHKEGEEIENESRSSGDGSNEEWGANIPTDAELDAILGPYIGTLASRMDTILKERLATKFAGSYLTGKLLSKNAYKVTIPDMNRIFSKKRKVDKPHYVFTLMLDESGSMEEGSRHRDAYMGAYLVEQVCKRMGFEVGVWKFGYRATKIKRVSDYRKIMSGGNDEYESLNAVQKTLDRSKDNIVLMITDGQIGSSPKELTTQLEKEGILVIGIGIGSVASEEVSKHYVHRVGVPRTEDLPKAMVEILKKLIHR